MAIFVRRPCRPFGSILSRPMTATTHMAYDDQESSGLKIPRWLEILRSDSIRLGGKTKNEESKEPLAQKHGPIRPKIWQKC